MNKNDQAWLYLEWQISLLQQQAESIAQIAETSSSKCKFIVLLDSILAEKEKFIGEQNKYKKPDPCDVEELLSE